MQPFWADAKSVSAQKPIAVANKPSVVALLEAKIIVSKADAVDDHSRASLVATT